MKKASNGQVLLGAFDLSLAVWFTACQCTPTQTSADLNRLQGYWEGDGSGGKCSITITANSLHYYGRPDHWFETTFTLPRGTDPQQLHATIKDCSPQEDSIGQVVFAFFKIEDGTLTLAVFDDGNDEQSKSFEDENIISIYKLRKIEPQKKNAELAEPK